MKTEKARKKAREIARQEISKNRIIDNIRPAAALALAEMAGWKPTAFQKEEFCRYWRSFQ